MSTTDTKNVESPLADILHKMRKDVVEADSNKDAQSPEKEGSVVDLSPVKSPPSEEGEVEEEEKPQKHTVLKEIESSIVVNAADPSIAALESAKTWESLNLSDDLLKGIHAKGFVHPSRIQELALPMVLQSKRHCIAQAHNGSGKTATFALCLLAKVQRETKTPQSLCVCHTRELARQNMDVIRELGKFTGITTWLVVPQGELCKYSVDSLTFGHPLTDDRGTGAQIVVGTPGKIREVIMKKVFITKDVSTLVLDEADVMMDHSSSMASQVAQIRQTFRSKIQILLFSATYPERVKKFVSAHVPDANRLEVKKEELTLSAVSQFYIDCSTEKNKFEVLSNLYGCMTVGQSVIFANSRQTAFRLAKQMKDEGHAVSLICGTQASGPERMDHEARERVMEEFRNGETKVLIATDILSRGIDVPQVTLVINYDLPMRYMENAVDQETYIHRVGRTGRFGLKGIAITLILPPQLHLIRQIENYYSSSILPLTEDPEQIEDMMRKLRK